MAITTLKQLMNKNINFVLRIGSVAIATQFPGNVQRPWTVKVTRVFPARTAPRAAEERENSYANNTTLKQKATVMLCAWHDGKSEERSLYNGDGGDKVCGR